MAKTPLIIASLLLAGQLSHAGDYIITIDGKSSEIALNEEIKVTTQDGQELSVSLKQKEYLEFESTYFSFKYKNHLKPVKSDLGEGIFQTIIMTPVGTGVIIQEYTDMNPKAITDLMIQEITKEEVDYGYKYREKLVSNKVGSRLIEGKEVTTSYPGEEWRRHFFGFGEKDKGIFIITFIEKDSYASEGHLIDDFWKNLKVSFD